MNKEDVLQFLKDNLYIISDSNSNILTSKFFRDFEVRDPNAKDSNSIKSTRYSSSSITKEDYKQFIVDAEIPRYINNGYGGRFAANNYSKPGFEAFKDAIKQYDKDILLAATKYYYKQTNLSRVMVTNFFKDGIYESFVDDVKKVLEKRNKDVGDPKDWVWVNPKIEEEGSSNMEQG